MARTAIGAVVADAESAFDDGWPTHPRDVVDEGDATTRFRTMYLGGAGVVAALHRLAQRGFVELQRDYVPGDLGTALYLADCIDGEGEPPLP